MRRFHLLSFVVATCFAGVLLGANLHGVYEDWFTGDEFNEIRTYSYGYPCTSVQFSGVFYSDRNEYVLGVALSMDGVKKEELRRVERGWMHVDCNPWFIEKAALAIDLCVLMAGGIATLFACEFLLRRREKPEASA